MADKQHLEECIRFASQARGATSPNPMVGAVVVRDAEVVGVGCTDAQVTLMLNELLSMKLVIGRAGRRSTSTLSLAAIKDARRLALMGSCNPVSSGWW